MSGFIDILKGIVLVAVLAGILRLLYVTETVKKPLVSIDKHYEKIESPRDLLPKSYDEDSKTIKTTKFNAYSYISAYSHIYLAKEKPLPMAITLSLHNTDKSNKLVIKDVLYYNTQGQLIRRYLKNGAVLSPLETKEIFVDKEDIDGGSGANFLVNYSHTSGLTQPVFETIMTSFSGNMSYIFKSRGENYIQ